jgi:Zn-dependent protease
MQQPEPAQPEENQQQSGNRRRRSGRLGAIAAAIGILAIKFKALLAVLLDLKVVLLASKLLAVSWTFVLSLVFYVLAFGWRIGIVLLFAIAAHELGHYAAYRSYGLAVRAPVFVPFLGAYTAGALAPDLESDAYIALAGPLTGLILAGACYAIGSITSDRFWMACAEIGAFLNLFNMIPVVPFDGGRVIGAIWPPLWIVGAIGFVAAAFWLHVPIFFMILIAILGLPAMISMLRGRVDPRAAHMTTAGRARVGIWYIATVLVLVYIMGQAQNALPPAGSF